MTLAHAVVPRSIKNAVEDRYLILPLFINWNFKHDFPDVLLVDEDAHDTTFTPLLIQHQLTQHQV